MNKLTLKDIELSGKRLLIRVDFNVPLDAELNITDDKRICAALPTIEYAIKQGAKIILMSHLGRPKGSRVKEMSLKPVAVRLSELLGQPIVFTEDCIGETVESQVSELQDASVMLLENLRFYKAETDNDPDFAAKLARLGDVFANDAFGTAHRAHASTEGVTRHFDTCVSGFLMEKELAFLGGALTEPRKPFVAILGGAKVADKIPVIRHLIDQVDKIIIGGGMMFTFIKARGHCIGNSLLDADSLDFAKLMLEKYPDKLVLPVDTIVSDHFDYAGREIGKTQLVSVDAIPEDTIGLDIGPESEVLFANTLKGAATVVWNGPMGVFEIPETAKGTLAMATTLAGLTDRGAITVIGGGDSASAVKKAGVADKMSHVSTGGGASLEFLQGKELPGVAALTDR
ncbi:phosphoglycerate kinase [bacterium]|nr:phosphoglycerate kinase [bacterium]